MSEQPTMSLRQQLSDLLPEILPNNPKEAIKGTELIQVVKSRVDGNYSDASLRYHFSIMSCDPGSPIAKVEKGQGYYRRTAPVPVLSGAQELISYTQGRLDDFSSDNDAINSTLNLMRKFRAVVSAYSSVNGLFPYTIRKAFGQNSPRSNLWKFPEVVMVDWQGDEASGDAVILEPETLKLKQSLGMAPYRLTAVRSRLEASYESYLEDFYQTLSSAAWAHGGELFYAAPIEDNALADALRSLSNTFGLGITTFGLNIEMLEDLPRPANILNAHPKETEALMERLDIQRIAAPNFKKQLDWTTLNNIRKSSEEVFDLFTWLNDCVEKGEATPFESEIA